MNRSSDSLHRDRIAERMRRPRSLRRGGPAIFAGCLAVLTSSISSAEQFELGPVAFDTGVTAISSFQTGSGVNYGAGAVDDPGDTKRTVMAASIEPWVELNSALGDSSVYAAASGVLAGSFFDGEVGGLFGRGGDEELETELLHVGWRNATFDVSVGAQDYIVGDGLVIGDGNLDTGADDGQYWLLPFSAWRNSAIARMKTDWLRVETFWLRSDRDFGAARLAGVNFERDLGQDRGTLGFMFFKILQGNRLNVDGMTVWNVRGADLRLPALAGLSLFGEYVAQRGDDDDGGGRDNAADGWYVEARYGIDDWEWQPAVHYRYMRLSGDEPDTPDNEEYRGLFFTTATRGWDTWYQGEVTGQYHLFNQNQITHMVKLNAEPSPRWILNLYYYRFDLDEPQYFGTPLSSTDWSDEVNLMVEYVPNPKFYVFAALAWSTPDSAAKAAFGDDDFLVFETMLILNF